MSKQARTYTPEFLFKKPATGSSISFACMGCQTVRMCLGARGVGPRKRCSACVAKRAQA